MASDVSAQPVLRSKQWAVRPYRLSDAADLFRVLQDQTIAKNTAAIPFPYTLAMARGWIRLSQARLRRSRTTQVHYAITINNRVVGGIGAHRHGQQSELGYWLGAAYRGRGLMTEVVKRFTRYLFRRWPIDRLVAKTFLFNPASARVLEKAGFSKTAYEVRAVCKKRRWLDANVYTRWR